MICANDIRGGCSILGFLVEGFIEFDSTIGSDSSESFPGRFSGIIAVITGDAILWLFSGSWAFLSLIKK